MAKDLFLGVGIGVVGAAAFKATVGGSIRRIDPDDPNAAGTRCTSTASA